MCNSFPRLNRRRFFGSATLLGIGSKLLRWESVRAENHVVATAIATTSSAEESMRKSNRENAPKIVWTSATCRDGNMPCLNADGHPVFENPHAWTVEQIDDIYHRFLHPRAMAFNIKWMGLSQYMKEGPYTTVRTRLEGQNRN